MGQIRVERTHEGRAARVLIDRPDKMNAMTVDMRAAFGEAVHELSGDEKVRAIVVRGVGDKAFSAGGDVAQFLDLAPHDLVDWGKEMEAAEACARDINGDIRVLDSGSGTCGLGTIVLAAAQAASDGASADEITAVVADLSARTRVYAVLDTLENLKKGGRIGNAKALLGSMLSIKPLLDFSSGEVEEAGKQRTRKKALEWLRSTVTDNADNIDRLAIAHAMADDIDAFVAQVAADTGRNDIRVDVVGPVVASHGGPGLVGVGMVLKA